MNGRVGPGEHRTAAPIPPGCRRALLAPAELDPVHLLHRPVLSIGSIGSLRPIGSIGSAMSAFSIGFLDVDRVTASQSNRSIMSHQSNRSVLSSQSNRATVARRTSGPVR